MNRMPGESNRIYQDPRKEKDEVLGRSAGHIEKSGDVWNVCVGRNCVQVDERIGRVIALALAVQDRREIPDMYQNRDKDADYSEEYRISRAAAFANCHKTVAYVLGLKPGEVHHYDDLATNIYLMIGGFEYKTVDTARDLADLLNDEDRFPLIGQVVSAYHEPSLTGHAAEPVHSFIVLGKSPFGKYICFEKTGYEHQPFRVSELSEIFADYSHDRKWAFRPLEDVERDARQLMENQGGE